MTVHKPDANADAEAAAKLNAEVAAEYASRTLPVSGLPVGPQGFTVTKVRTFRGIDGEGCEAEVALDGKPAGCIEDGGTGGGAWFRPLSAEARVAWEAFVAATPAYNMDPLHEYGETDLIVDGEEAVAELLVTEALVAKKLAAVVKKGQRTAFVAPDMDRRTTFGTIVGDVAYAPLPEGALVWNGTEYVAP